MQHDREKAGSAVVKELLAHGSQEGSVVVGIPRGGVMVAARVALELGLDYECVPVCRIAVPCFPDLTLGVVDPDGNVTFDPHSQITKHEMTRVGGELAERLVHQVERCRGDRTPVDLSGRDVIVVDESLTNALMPRAIMDYLTRHGARRVSMAVPVATPAALAAAREILDEAVAAETASANRVSRWYGGPEPSDDEIHACLLSAWSASPS